MSGAPFRACPACDRDEPAVLLTTRDHLSLETFTVVRCTACGLLYLGDAPDASRLGAYYDNEMGDGMHQEPGRLFRNLRRIRIDRDLAPLRRLLADDAVVMDFGTGDGSVARRLREQGVRTVAVDMFEPAAWPHADIPYRSFDPGAAFGTDLFLHDGRPVDAMVLRHVLEHVLAPRELLAAAHDAGVRTVMLTVPNVDSRLRRPLGAAWSHWDPPRHLTYFTPDTLRATASRAGYDVVRLRTYGIDELVSSLNRVVSISHAEATPGLRRRALGATLPLLKAKGPLSALSASASTIVANCVCHAVLVAR